MLPESGTPASNEVDWLNAPERFTRWVAKG
jgi:hypothetical protein